MTVGIRSQVDGDTTVITVIDLDGSPDRRRFRSDLQLHAARGNGPLVVDLSPVPVVELTYRSVLLSVTAGAARSGRAVRVVGMPPP